MDCKQAEKMIQPYVKGRIPERELEAFIGHVRSCPSCYEELETYFIVNRAMAYFENEEQTSYNLTGLLERDLCEKEQMARKRKRREKFFRGFWIFLVCLLLILGLHYFEIIELPGLKGLL